MGLREGRKRGWSMELRHEGAKPFEPRKDPLDGPALGIESLIPWQQ